MPEQGGLGGSYQVWLSHPQGSLRPCPLCTPVCQALKPPDCPTPLLFYWKAIVAARPPSWAGSWGLREKDKVNPFQILSINMKYVSKSWKDKSQHVMEMTCEPSSDTEASRKVYKTHRLAV